MSLSRLIEEHVSTVFLNMDHFAERITVVSDSDNQMTVTAVIDIPDTNGGDVEGRMQVSAAEATRFTFRAGIPYQFTRKGIVFDIYDEMPEEMGLVTLLVRKKKETNRHTDIYDIDGEQAVWHEV
jgi:hypothetical protein